jgi:hypothetical protein
MGLRFVKITRCCVIQELIMLVVLLDEADVFLEQRKISDLQRNALVSGQ